MCLWILSLCATAGVNTPSIKKNLISASLLCQDGFKLAIESNKVVISRYGQFIGKGYDSRGLFHFSLSNFCNKVVNHMCDPNSFVADMLLVLLNTNRNNPQAHKSTVVALHSEVFRVSYFPQGTVVNLLSSSSKDNTRIELVEGREDSYGFRV
jgi:hypothetical protein